MQNVMERKMWDPKGGRRPSKVPREAPQLRHPLPATEALSSSGVDLERKRVAHEVTQRQGSLLRQERRQRRMDGWLTEAPIRMLPKHSKLHQARHVELHTYAFLSKA